MSSFCHGVASAQSLDKSGEMVDIKGLDITSLPKTGILNYEHKSDIPGQICGKILTAKKIFNKNEAKFKAGVGTSFELEQSQQDYTTNILKHTQTIMNLLNAKADLDKAMGTK